MSQDKFYTWKNSYFHPGRRHGSFIPGSLLEYHGLPPKCRPIFTEKERERVISSVRWHLCQFRAAPVDCSPQHTVSWYCVIPQNTVQQHLYQFWGSCTPESWYSYLLKKVLECYSIVGYSQSVWYNTYTNFGGCCTRESRHSYLLKPQALTSASGNHPAFLINQCTLIQFYLISQKKLWPLPH